MANQLTRKALVLVKSESSYGVDASPSAATDAILLDEGSGIPWQLDTKLVERQSLRESMTPGKILVGRQMSKLTLNTYLMGNGSATAAPKWAPLIKACGTSMSSGGTVGQSSSWMFVPVSSGFTGASIYTYLDGLLHKALGCYGSFAISMVHSGVADLKFMLDGSYVAPTEAAMPAATMPTDTKELVQNEALTIGSYNSAAGLVPVSLDLDWGLERREIGDMTKAYGFGGLDIKLRRPTLKIRCCATDDLDAKNFFTYLTSPPATDGAMDNITLSHGSGAQTKINITINAPQLVGVQYADMDGGRMYDLSYRLRNTTAEGEFKLEVVEKL